MSLYFNVCFTELPCIGRLVPTWLIIFLDYFLSFSSRPRDKVIYCVRLFCESPRSPPRWWRSPAPPKAVGSWSSGLKAGLVTSWREHPIYSVWAVLDPTAGTQVRSGKALGGKRCLGQGGRCVTGKPRALSGQFLPSFGEPALFVFLFPLFQCLFNLHGSPCRVWSRHGPSGLCCNFLFASAACQC